MKVLVIGAAGKSGRAVVEQALVAGHDVTAFAHKTEGYLPDSNVHVIEGDARDRSTMDSAMLGQDAVIDTIGGKLSFKTTTKQVPPRPSLPLCSQAEFAASWSFP
jgi:putative NADH-flavin reductase